MAFSVLPALMSALVTAAQGEFDLADVSVAYGKPIDGGSGDFLWIGLDDPEAEWMSLASATREWESVGLDADVTEEGDIPCVAMAWDGDSDLQNAVERAFEIAETLFTLLRDNPNLGLIEVSWTLPGRDLAAEYQPVDQGVQVRIPFSIHYVALI